MKKTIKAFILFALLSVIMTSVCVTAGASYTENGFFYTVEDGEATVTGFSEEITESLVIPSTLGGYPVTAIGDSAFEYQWDMPSVVVPEGVRTIGSRAFRCCYALEEITLPSTLTVVGISAFASCEILRVNHPDLAGWVQIDFDGMHATPVYWDDDEEDPLTEIYFGDSTEPIRDVVIPEGVTRIGTWVFGNNETIESLVIPDSVTEIGERAFFDCGRLLTVDFGEGLECIGEFAFDGCENLSNFTLPDSLLTIGDWAFSSNTAITEVTVPDKVEVIPLGAFSYCTALETVNIGAGVEIIGQQAFYKAGLTEVIIPDNVIAINLRAFQECKALETVVIGDGVTTVADKVFYDCTALKNLTIGDSLTSYPENFLKLQDKKESDYIPDDWLHIEKLIIGDGLTALPTEIIKREYLKEIVIGDGISVIPEYQFSAYSNLESVVIGDGVNTIGRSAFENCGKLESVTMGDGAEIIGQRAFALCRKLKAVRIPAATEAIEESAFAQCSSLESVTFEEGELTTIGDYAFTECSKLEAVQFYDGLEYIGDRAFYCCSSLTELVIPGSVEYTSYYSFSGCTGLTSVTFCEGFEYVGIASFYNCGSLSEINFPSTLTVIDSSAFENNKYITELDLSSYTSLEEIGTWAFAECVRLSEIALPEQSIYITSTTFYNTSYYNNEENWTDGALIIGNNFLEYYYLTVPEAYGRYIIPDGIKTIAQGAFSTCMNLRSVVIPESVEIIGMDAFADTELLTKIYYLSDEADWDLIDINEYVDFTGIEIVYSYVICEHEDVRNDSGYSQTCTLPGFTEGVFCNDCGEWVSGHIVIEAGHPDSNTDGICDLCNENLSDITLNTVQTVAFNEYERLDLMFVPLATGKYTLTSMGQVDPNVYLYDSQKNELAYHDDIGYENEDDPDWEYNFSLTYTLEKGRIYYWSVFDGYLGSFDIILTFECEAHSGGNATCMLPAVCENCGEAYGGVNAQAHKWNEGSVTTTATCKVTGVKTYVCEYNSQHTCTEELGLNASNHVNTRSVTEVKSTCSETGFTAGIFCNDCESYVSGHTVISVNSEAHKWNAGEITTVAACNVNGIKTYTCQHNSNHTYTEELGLNASNHVNTRSVPEAPATYDKVGYTAGVYCDGCQKYISGHTEIPMLKPVFTDTEKAVNDGVNVIMNPGLTSAQLLEQASKGATVKDIHGNPVPFDKPVGTGMVLVLSDGTEIEIVVFGDVDGDGIQSASDARLALRASVGLEKYDTDSCYYKAANVGTGDSLSAADARMILRASVGLETIDVFKKD